MFLSGEFVCVADDSERGCLRQRELVSLPRPLSASRRIRAVGIEEVEGVDLLAGVVSENLVGTKGHLSILLQNLVDEDEGVLEGLSPYNRRSTDSDVGIKWSGSAFAFAPPLA